MKEIDPYSEAKRLQDLAATGIMDSLPEKAYDDIATLAAYICDSPVAYISFLDDQRQWYKSRINLPLEETTLDEALCSQTIREQGLVHVPDLTLDERFKDNPFVAPEDGIRFYAGYPLINSNGSALGTLCVVDYKRRELDEQQKFALEALGRQIVTQLELRRILNESNHQALHDALTKLPNRLLLSERIAQSLRHATQNKGVCAVLFVDLDHFKEINDQWGHQAGDVVLAEVASRLQKNIRQQDTVGRYGGDEFVAVIHDIPDIQVVDRIVSNIQQALEEPVAYNGTQITIQASIGTSIFPEQASTAEELIKRADLALYQAKQYSREASES